MRTDPQHICAELDDERPAASRPPATEHRGRPRPPATTRPGYELEGLFLAYEAVFWALGA
jgi:hypothetical protein